MSRWKSTDVNNVSAFCTQKLDSCTKIQLGKRVRNDKILMHIQFFKFLIKNREENNINLEIPLEWHAFFVNNGMLFLRGAACNYE